MALLVHPGWRDVPRVEAYAARIAEKHPGAVVSIAGTGMPPYQAARAALKAGLRVAYFAPEPFPPSVSPPRRPEREDEERRPERQTSYHVTLSELEPGVQEHHDQLWRSERRLVSRTVGHRAAELGALVEAWNAAEHVVVFTHVAGWPPLGKTGATVIEP